MSRWPYGFNFDDVVIEYGRLDDGWVPDEGATGVKVFHSPTEAEVIITALATRDANLTAAFRRLDRRLRAPIG